MIVESKVRIRACEGRTVFIEGAPRRYLAPGQVTEVEWSAYWERRKLRGDIELVAATTAGE
jgi:hypothetical protein